MLDMHVISGTPGAATVLGSAFTTVAPGGDGATFAGTPIISTSGTAVLKMWGLLTIAANTVGAAKLSSQDQVDPINGETYVPGAASLLNETLFYTHLPYKSGQRAISAGTNTGVDAASAYLVDLYSGGQCVNDAQGNIVVTGANTFGGALTIGTWGQLAYNPTQLKAGKYAILGVYVSAVSYGAVIRFRHADFGQFCPGFPVANYETISTSTWDKIDKDELLLTQHGYQFVKLSKELGVACCPVFSVGNTGTGLTIEMCSRVADTPVVVLVLAKVG